MMLRPNHMRTLAYVNARYPNAVRWSWVALVLVLAACNNSGSSGGAAPGY
jgi:hypothetical protein